MQNGDPGLVGWFFGEGRTAPPDPMGTSEVRSDVLPGTSVWSGVAGREDIMVSWPRWLPTPWDRRPSVGPMHPQRAGPDDRLRGDFARLKRERSSTLHTMAGSGRLGGRSLLLLLLVGFVKITIVRASVPALLRICLPGLVRPKRSPNPEKI